MLSAESASGAHPVLSVEMMDRIARQAEGYLWEDSSFECFHHEPACAPPIPFGDAVAQSTAQLSRDLAVRAIVVVSQSGMSATTMSAARPAAPGGMRVVVPGDLPPHGAALGQHSLARPRRRARRCGLSLALSRALARARATGPVHPARTLVQRRSSPQHAVHHPAHGVNRSGRRGPTRSAFSSYRARTRPK